MVWSEPMRTVAKRFAISDVGLAKACRQADVIPPPRGYWAKLAAGKRVAKPALTPRGPGMSDLVRIGRLQWGDRGYLADILEQPDPPVPEFAETLDDLSARLRGQIGHVRRTRDLAAAHAPIAKLLKQDELRRQRLAESPYSVWDRPLCESPFEQRRLAILESLCRGLDKVAATISIDGSEGRDLLALVGDQCVSFKLDSAGGRPTHASTPQATAKTTPMRLQIMSQRGSATAIESWTDSASARIENLLADIVLAIVVHGERQHRENAYSYREWIIKRKAEEVEERRRAEEERLRLERKRQARLEKARVDRLLAQSLALRKAQSIRAFVEAVRAAPMPVDRPKEVDVDAWAAWALAQADNVDPIRSGTFWAAQVDVQGHQQEAGSANDDLS